MNLQNRNKGYGNGFVSKLTRFNDNTNININNNNGIGSFQSSTPGPGTYSIMETTDMAAMIKNNNNNSSKMTNNNNRAKSSMFAQPVTRIGPPFEPSNSTWNGTPGPGLYHNNYHNDTTDATNSSDISTKNNNSYMYTSGRAVGSAFRSGIKRFEEYVLLLLFF